MDDVAFDVAFPFSYGICRNGGASASERMDNPFPSPADSLKKYKMWRGVKSHNFVKRATTFLVVEAWSAILVLNGHLPVFLEFVCQRILLADWDFFDRAPFLFTLFA